MNAARSPLPTAENRADAMEDQADMVRDNTEATADNMEDKGIEMKRAQNLQKLLIDRVSVYDSIQYQMNEVLLIKVKMINIKIM